MLMVAQLPILLELTHLAASNPAFAGGEEIAAQG